MLTYFINAILCSGLLFIFYKLFLEYEKMYNFNRVYLLSSIVVSLVIPLISIGSLSEQMHLSGDNDIINGFNNIIINKTATEEANFLAIALLVIYSLVCLNLIFRFILNIYLLQAKARANKRISYRNANIVLLPEKIVPYTFLNNIFICAADYQNQNPEKALLDHELAHVQQQHSLDILFVGFIELFFWFNPMLFFYKRAIKLNHEFLADEVVLRSCDVVTYQQLLLEKINHKTGYNLSSGLNYIAAKKRFVMMSKSTGKRMAAIKKFALLPLACCVFIVCCSKSVNQEEPLKSYYAALEKIEKTPATIYNGLSVTGYRRKDIEELRNLYAALSNEQKATTRKPAIISLYQPTGSQKTANGITVSNIRRTPAN